MKIISQESENYDIEYCLKKDLLIPCFVYKIPIETSRGKHLNFLEQTILELINVDNSLKDDDVRLSKILGFYSNNKLDDKTKIIKLILTKLKSLRYDLTVNADNTEVTVYQFYQEAYSNELLPIITKEINDFSYIEKEVRKGCYKEILFKKDIQSKYKTTAILPNKFKTNNPTKPTKADIIKTIYLHNQNKYRGSHTIDYKNFNIDICYSELMFLHSKFFIPVNNIKSFVITNGFTNDFSTTLRKVFESRHLDLLQDIRRERKSESDIIGHKDVEIPFDSSINRYGEIKELIKIIEKENYRIRQNSSSIDIVKKSKIDLISSLFDLVEKCFFIYTKELMVNKSIRDKKLLKGLAKDIGFNIDLNKQLLIFNVDSRENFQNFLAKSLVYKKNELYELASKFPDLFNTLNELLELRNGVKHSDKEETIDKVNEDDLVYYSKLIYSIVSIILQVKQIAVSSDDVDDDDIVLFQNAYIDLEREIDIDVMNKLPEEVKNNLTSVNYYLNEVDFDTNKFNVVKEVVNNLYSSFDLILRRIINILIIDYENITIPNKDIVLEKIRSKIEIGESLYCVSPVLLENGFKKKDASLGAYMLVYLYKKEDISQEDVKLIEEIISLRGHGSPNIEDIEKITLEELMEIKQKSFNLIIRLMEEE